jgi:hypothetical protein
MLAALDRFFNRPVTKFILAFLIILSVLPLQEVRRFDLLFFGIFSAELVVRIFLFKRAKRKRAFEVVMMAIDTVAVLSFLPIPNQLVQTRYLRLVRLVRLSLLLRFATSLARDMWAIVSRKEIKYQLSFLLGAVLILTFLSGIVLHALQVSVDLDNDGVVEPGTLKDLLWWSFREIESQDNITQNLHGSLVYILASILLTLAGVFVMSLIIGVGASVVEELLAVSRGKPVALSDHIMVIGRGRNLHQLLEEIIRIMRKNREKPSIALLSDEEKPPAFLYERVLKRVEYRTGNPSDLSDLKLVNAAESGKTLIMYDDEKKGLADAYTVSTMMAVREETAGPIVVELRDDDNLETALRAGGANITAVPMGKFLGTVLCQNLVFPGMDRVFEELMTARGSEIYTTFFTEDEKQQLGRRGGAVDFKDLLLASYRSRGVVMIGVMIEENGVTRRWVNPLSTAHEDGREPGRVELKALSGLMGVAREKKHLDAVRATVLSGLATPQGPGLPEAEVDYTLSQSLTRLRHVLVVGENENLPSMIRETTQFAPRVEFTVVIPGRERGESLQTRLTESLGCTAEREEGRRSLWTCTRLSGQHHLTLLCCDEDVTAMMTDPALWEEKNFDAAVFLSDIGAVDPDAQSLLWLYRLMELIDQGTIKVSENFHVLAEISEWAKGELLEKRFLRKSGRRRVRAISTRKIRTYFMAQSCLVPDLWDDVYSELLTSEGEDLCQLILRDPSGTVTFGQLLALFAQDGLILLGVELAAHSGSTPLLVNPRTGSDEATIDLANIRNLYVVGDTEQIVSMRSSRASFFAFHGKD